MLNFLVVVLEGHFPDHQGFGLLELVAFVEVCSPSSERNFQAEGDHLGICQGCYADYCN